MKVGLYASTYVWTVAEVTDDNVRISRVMTINPSFRKPGSTKTVYRWVPRVKITDAPRVIVTPPDLERA
jgi:hypothetical protein